MAQSNCRDGIICPVGYLWSVNERDEVVVGWFASTDATDGTQGLCESYTELGRGGKGSTDRNVNFSRNVSFRVSCLVKSVFDKDFTVGLDD